MRMFLGDVLSEFREKPAPDAEPPVLTLTERNGFVRQDERFKKRLTKEDTSEYKLVRSNDIAFNPYLLWAGAIAQNTIVESGVISPLYPTFRVNPGFDARYVGRLLHTEQLIGAYDGIAFGSVPRRRRSSVRDFLSLPIPDQPSLDEQRRIAAILDKADDLRAKQQEETSRLDSLTQSIFTDIFGDCEPNEAAGDFLEVQGGLQVTSKRNTLPVEVSYLRVANSFRARLDLGEVKTLRATETEIARTRLEPGDLLFVEGHGNPLEVGRVSMWEGQLATCVHQNHLIRGRVKAGLLPEFAMAWFNSRAGAGYFQRAGRTTSGLNTISASTVKSAPLPVPPIDRQRQFVDAVAHIRDQFKRCNQRANELDMLFTSIQARAFRGEL
ncbi:restriction endonuclease subunit S [Enemella evansiae]|nr:restriction endonuclease subunit S [Enemella evansiae]